MNESSVYSTWNITTLDHSRAHVKFETNDDNDDGVPEEPVFNEYDTTMNIAINVAGKSRTGVNGAVVTVYLDGKKI